MSKTQHTPGPWRIGTPPPNGEQTIGTQQGLMVAVATTGSGTPTKANARLIAAAPELLEALKKIDQTLQIPAAEYVPAIGDVFKLIDAAIAKATGGGNE